MTGSIRYMSPEVYKDLPYTNTCDTYSFALLVWEMLTLKKPYEDMGTIDRLVRRVFERGHRPRIPSSWPPGLRDTIQKGWEHDLSKRANMASVARSLQSIVENRVLSCDSVDTTSVTSQGSQNLRFKQPTNLMRRCSSRVYEFSRETRPIFRVSSGLKKQLRSDANGALTCRGEDPHR